MSDRLEEVFDVYEEHFRDLKKVYDALHVIKKYDSKWNGDPEDYLPDDFESTVSETTKTLIQNINLTTGDLSRLFLETLKTPSFDKKQPPSILPGDEIICHDATGTRTLEEGFYYTVHDTWGHPVDKVVLDGMGKNLTKISYKADRFVPVER